MKLILWIRFISILIISNFFGFFGDRFWSIFCNPLLLFSFGWFSLERIAVKLLSL